MSEEITLGQLFAGMVLFWASIFLLASLNIRCRLGFHHTFTNTQFCEYSNWGKQTERCDRCWKDLTEPKWVDMDAEE